MKSLLIVMAYLILAAMVWGSCILLQPATAARRTTMMLHEGTVHSLAFSPDGRYLVGGSAGISEDEGGYWQGSIKVWDVATFKLMASLDLPQHVRSLAFSPNSSLLAAGCININDRGSGLGYKAQPGEVRVLSFPKLKEEKKFELSHGSINKVLFSGDGKFFAASFSKQHHPSRLSGHLSIWSVPNWNVVRQIEDPLVWEMPITRGIKESSFLSVSCTAYGLGVKQVSEINPDRERKEDTSLVTIDRQTHATTINSVASFTDHRRLLYHWGGVRILNLENGKEDTPIALGKATNNSTAFMVSEDGKWLACAVTRIGNRPRGHGWVVLWDLVRQELLDEFAWPEDLIRLTSIAISPDKKILAVGANKLRYSEGKYQQGEVVVYDISKIAIRKE